MTTPSASSKSKLTRRRAALDDSTSELSEIKQSVERLRAQRAHVEQLREHNEELELLASEQAREVEQLRAELASLRGVEQENVGLLQSFKLLEERLRSLEDVCRATRHELKGANERAAAADAQRSHVEATMRELEREHEQRVAALKSKQTTLVDRIRQLERDHDAIVDAQQQLEQQWRAKVQQARHDAVADHHETQRELEVSRKETKTLQTEVAALETQVQSLLTTTVRQTSMIEDCDRVLSETKTQQKSAKASYHDQLALNGRLHEQIQQLEAQLSTHDVERESARANFERQVRELESKLRKRKDRIEILQVAIHERDKQLETLERETATRSESVEHLEEVRAGALREEDTSLRCSLLAFARFAAGGRDEAPRARAAERDLGAASGAWGTSKRFMR